MSKIKLSILLLVSFFTFSCTNHLINQSNQKYSLAYIGGEYDGLLLKNNIISNLQGLNIYNPNSHLEIKANISHSSNLYITNIDNTSDREKISTKLSIQVFNKKINCNIYDDEMNVSQFYIYASSDKLLSNQTALKKIKKNNTETVVRQFINKLQKVNHICDE